jgi:hypothetical protein
MAAPTNSKSANQSAYGLLKYKNITATAGAASNLIAVNMFGVVHISYSLLAKRIGNL